VGVFLPLHHYYFEHSCTPCFIRNLLPKGQDAGNQATAAFEMKSICFWHNSSSPLVAGLVYSWQKAWSIEGTRLNALTHYVDYPKRPGIPRISCRNMNWNKCAYGLLSVCPKDFIRSVINSVAKKTIEGTAPLTLLCGGLAHTEEGLKTYTWNVVQFFLLVTLPSRWIYDLSPFGSSNAISYGQRNPLLDGSSGLPHAFLWQLMSHKANKHEMKSNSCFTPTS